MEDPKAQDDALVEWLTPGPLGEVAHFRWPDESGPFEVTPHLAYVNGETIVVGLDVRSFREHPPDEHGRPGRRVPVGERLAKVESATIHGLRISEIADRARLELVAFPSFVERVAVGAGAKRAHAAQREEYRRRLEMLTSRGTARKRRPAAGDDLIARVAGLYRAALASGGEPARKPSKHVHAGLTAEGTETTAVQVRKWIARARRDGLLPPTEPRRAGQTREAEGL